MIENKFCAGFLSCCIFITKSSYGSYLQCCSESFLKILGTADILGYFQSRPHNSHAIYLWPAFQILYNPSKYILTYFLKLACRKNLVNSSTTSAEVTLWLCNTPSSCRWDQTVQQNSCMGFSCNEEQWDSHMQWSNILHQHLYYTIIIVLLSKTTSMARS